MHHNQIYIGGPKKKHQICSVCDVHEIESELKEPGGIKNVQVEKSKKVKRLGRWTRKFESKGIKCHFMDICIMACHFLTTAILFITLLYLGS